MEQELNENDAKMKQFMDKFQLFDEKMNEIIKVYVKILEIEQLCQYLHFLRDGETKKAKKLCN